MDPPTSSSSTTTITVTLATMTGRQVALDVASAALTGAELYAAAAARLGLETGRFALMLRGDKLPSSRQDTVKLSAGDSLLVVPQRRAPTESARAAAAAALRGAAPGGGGDNADGDDDEDEDPLRFRLAPDAPRWHRTLAAWLRRELRAPDAALTFIFLAGPGRLAVLAAVLAGARVAHAWGLGPVYLMAAIIAGIFMNLGTRREGEASAYSIFNPGVQRLPGQLDAGVFDRQLRRGGGI